MLRVTLTVLLVKVMTALGVPNAPPLRIANAAPVVRPSIALRQRCLAKPAVISAELEQARTRALVLVAHQLLTESVVTVYLESLTMLVPL